MFDCVYLNGAAGENTKEINLFLQNFYSNVSFVMYFEEVICTQVGKIINKCILTKNKYIVGIY
jgi:hypothetical protein